MLILGCLGFILWKAKSIGVIHKTSVAEKIDGKINQNTYTYENKQSVYKINIPNNWGVSEAASDQFFESRAEFIPPESELKVIKIDIEVLKKGQSVTALSTDAEFKTWESAKEGDTVKGVTKIGEDTVSGQKVMLLADLSKMGDSPTDNSWGILGWFKKDGRNFYVKMFGKESMDDADKQVFRYLLSTMEVQ